jgi:dTDP-4-amino-4,6-dideoxygalactose transaminase
MGRTYGYRESDLPLTEELSGRLLRLPLYYEISEQEQGHVVGEMTNFLEQAAMRRRTQAGMLQA